MNLRVPLLLFQMFCFLGKIKGEAGLRFCCCGKVRELWYTVLQLVNKAGRYRCHGVWKRFAKGCPVK